MEGLVTQRTVALMESNEQLKREIVEREKTNKEKIHLEVNLKRAEKMEAVGILAGSVAHDLNNILGGILNCPELILLDMPKDSPLRKPILTIKQSGERAAAVVQDLFTLARRGIVDAKAIDMNKILSDFFESPEYHNLLAKHSDITVDKKVVAIQPGQKAVIVSGFAQSKRVESALALGAGGYDRKPYTIEQLAVVVKNERISNSKRGLIETLKVAMLIKYCCPYILS